MNKIPVFPCVTFVSERHGAGCGSRDFACGDPEGNLWSFGTYWPDVGEPPLAP